MMLAHPVSYAIIHIGSSTMSLSIVEYKNIDDIKIIEQATREVTYGEELFQTQRLSFSTMHEICAVLKGYKELMDVYGITEYKALATSVIREAENKRNIIDQIYVQTGLEVEILDMPREIYFKYFALYRNMMHIGLTETHDAVLFLDVTSGGLGITVWQQGQLLFQENMHIGAVRVFESFSRNQRGSASFPVAVEEYMHSMLRPIVRELHRFNIRYLVLSGDESRPVAEMMGVKIIGDNIIIEPRQYEDFYNEFNGVTPTKLANLYHVPEHRANILMPVMVMYHEILTLVPVKSICINTTTFREGSVLYYGAERERPPYLEEMRMQNLQLARAIANRYHYEASHVEQIDAYGLTILGLIAEWAGLSSRSEFLFRMVCILHGIGKHINLRRHNEQSYNVIMGTDIFGLSEIEKEVVANVAYYYYKGTPSDRDENFERLTEIQKMMTIKLVAIFRLARALDVSHLEKIHSIEATLADGTLTIRANTDQNIALERWSFEREAHMFKDVFGIRAVLEQGRS